MTVLVSIFSVEQTVLRGSHRRRSDSALEIQPRQTFESGHCLVRNNNGQENRSARAIARP